MLPNKLFTLFEALGRILGVVAVGGQHRGCGAHPGASFFCLAVPAKYQGDIAEYTLDEMIRYFVNKNIED